jgi:hypothetical protein
VSHDAVKGRVGPPSADRNGTRQPAFTPITYDDVLAWVKAGTAEGGKDLSAIESHP